MGVWRRRGEAASAGLSAALYSAYHGLYSEAVVSSTAPAAALVEVGRFRDAVQCVQKAAKALYEAAKEVFERVRVPLQRLVELFVEAVARVLGWVDEHKAYLFLMAAAAAGVVALSAALNLWGSIELDKLAYAAVGTPFVVGLVDTGGRAAERFKMLTERYEKWRVDENVINEFINAPLNRERPYKALLRLADSPNLPPPLAKLKEALEHVQDEVVQDAAVVAALVLYKTLVKNAESYGEWAAWYEWARGLVKEREFTVKVEEVKRLHEAHRGLEEAAEEVRRELNSVLALYALHSRDLYEKLRPHLEVDLGKAEELAEARSKELSEFEDVNMGTKAYAAMLSVARGGIYGHVATLLMGEGALADVVLLTPISAYNKADRIAGRRGEAVDPSYSGRRGRSVGQPSWEDRAASVLLRFLIGYGEADLKFIRVEKEGKKDDEKGRIERGFRGFRVYGGVEAPVGELWIGETAYFKVSKEELRRFVEEAKETAPDLSGIKKIWHALPWLNTDVSFAGKWVEAATADIRQAAWYIALFGEPKTTSGRANVTRKGGRPIVTMFWPREVLDRIIAEEGEELKSLLGRVVKSWRELVDAIDWSWALERVRKLADELKSWIGPEKMNNAEREGLVRKMLGELALFVHFAEARRGMDDSKWREERVKRLAKAVEALSGGRIAGDDATELAKLIIYYAESRKESVKERIDKLAEELAGISKEEVWNIVQFVLGDMYCLARDCARDEVVRKFVEPALELVMLDKALNGKFDREEALLLFGEMYATAVAGDGHVGPREIRLAVGGELGGGSALLRLATLHLLNQLLPDELKFGVRAYVRNGSLYNIVTYGENAARFMRLLAVSAPSAGGEYLSGKLDQFVEAAQVEVRLGDIWLTASGNVTADLTISEASIAVKYNVYLSEDAIELQFNSTDRSRVELAACLLRLAGVSAEVKKKEDGKRDVWYVVATTDALAAGRRELRDAIRKVVKEALEKGLVGEKKARSWLEKLERGVATWEGKKFMVTLARGALVVRFRSTNRESLEEVAREFKAMCLEEGVHFAVRWSGGRGRVSLLAEGVRRLAWLSIHGEGEQRRRAAEFLKFLEARAKGGEVLRKLEALLEEGRSRGALRLVGLEKDGVKVLDVKTEEKGDKLYVTIKAEVDGVAGEYKITFYRERSGAKRLQFFMRSGAARAVKLVEVLTGERPSVMEMPNGLTRIRGSERHIEALARYEELMEAIEKWSNR